MELNEKKEIKEELKELQKKGKPVVISKPTPMVKPIVSKEKPVLSFPPQVYYLPKDDAILIFSSCEKYLISNISPTDQLQWFHNKFYTKQETRDLLIAKEKYVFFY